jgi:hypothetical protein
MTPEERFHELDIAGCTWELMRQIDEQELIRIIKGQRLEKCWSGKDRCEFSALWQLRQAENGEPVLFASSPAVGVCGKVYARIRMVRKIGRTTASIR